MTDREPEAPGEELVGELAHVLRTPLMLVTGYAEALVRAADGPARDAAAVKLTRATERLGRAVDAVVDAFSVPSGSLSSRPVGIRLGDVVAKALEQAGSTAAAEPALERWPVVAGDRRWLERAFAALLAAGRPVRVEASVRGGRVAIAIEYGDEADGADVLELYLARRVLELHGGSCRRTGASGVAIDLPVR